MTQEIYNWRLTNGRVGEVDDSMPMEVISLINESGRTAQVDTITVDTATNSHTYTLKIDGVTISFTADASATTAEVGIGLVAAINAEDLVNGRVVAAVTADPDFTITARTAGVGFTTSDVDAKCTLANTTANAAATEVDFGTLMIEDGTVGTKCKVASSANMSAMVVNATPAAENSLTYTLGVRIGGITYQGNYTSDADATVQEIVEGLTAVLNAQLPANTVVVTEDNAKCILTAEVAGVDFEVIAGAAGSTGVWTIAYATGAQGFSPTTNVDQAAKGIAMYVRNEEVESDGTMEYSANSVVSILKKGRIVVETQAAATSALPVFVGMGASTKGKWTTAATANYVRLDPNKFKWVKALSSSKAVLEVNL